MIHKIYIKSDSSQFSYRPARIYKNVKSFYLSQACIFNSSYLINNNNKSFSIGSTTININEGNYTASELATHLQTIIINSGFLSSSVSYNDNTFKFSINLPSAQTITMTNSLANILGFTSNNLTSNTSHVSNKCANLTPVHYYMINTKEVDSYNDNNAHNSDYDIIFNNLQPGSMLLYNKDLAIDQNIYIYDKESNKQIDEITVKVYDQYNELINFNGVSYILVYNVVCY